jgi:hypothetical protein
MSANSAIRFPGSSSDAASDPSRGQDAVIPADHPETPTRPPGVRKDQDKDPLLTADDVAQRLSVTKDWVWDHSSRKAPYLPVIRMGDGTLRYRAGRIEEFIDQRERLTQIRRKRA